MERMAAVPVTGKCWVTDADACSNLHSINSRTCKTYA